MKANQIVEAAEMETVEVVVVAEVVAGVIGILTIRSTLQLRSTASDDPQMP